MSILSGKKILLGISGGIAAYKTPNLVRSFIKQGAEVKVVMTDSAKEFVTPLSLSTVSNNPVFSSFKSDEDDGMWNNHVELGLWCDIMLICPATANTLFKMANGNCDNLLIAVYLSCKSAPIVRHTGGCTPLWHIPLRLRQGVYRITRRRAQGYALPARQSVGVLEAIIRPGSRITPRFQ